MRLLYPLALLTITVTVHAQTPAARLGVPVAPVSSPATLGPVARGASPDPFRDMPKSARLGEIGVGPTDRGSDDPYNWGVPPRRSRDADLASRRAPERTRPPINDPRDDRPLDRYRDDPYSDRDYSPFRRGAYLRDPRTGRTTGFGGGDRRLDEQFGDWWQDRQRDWDEGVLGLRGRGNSDRLAFQSDCAFDDFISPVTNPFLAEDPRALTELRPIFMYQTIPSKQYYYQGGNALFFGLQGRLAFNERFSLVLHKLGGLSLNPGSNSPVESATGLTEIHIGPKFAFWRAPDTQSLGSFGLIFQMPLGGDTVFQDTGKLSLVPYLSYGQRLTRTPVGTLNFMNIAGYSLGTNSSRSDYLYDTFQLAWDVADQHWFYPFVELSWFYYTSNGTQRPGLDFEGRDLANIGAPVSGRSYLSIAPGARFKASETLQFGVAAEFPLLGTKDLMQFRLTVDIIWRY